MAKSIKNPDIFCLESLWETNPNLQRKSVYPLLQVLQMEYNINIAHLNCNTVEELSHNLKLAYKNYGILYLAFHGRPGNIIVQENIISLDMLADMMGRKFRNCGVHFATCETLNIPRNAINNFIEKTGVSFVSGYRKSVYWMPSAAVDLVYLDCLVNNITNPEIAVQRLKEQVMPSSKNLGFTFIG